MIRFFRDDSRNLSRIRQWWFVPDDRFRLRPVRVGSLDDCCRIHYNVLNRSPDDMPAGCCRMDD